MKSAAIQLLAAFPVFLLGAVVVLITYQIRLSWHQSEPADDFTSLHLQQAQQEAGGPATTALAAAQQLPANEQQPQPKQPAAVPVDTLVIYIFNEDDPVYPSNFQHFLAVAVQENSRCSYIVLVQERSLHSAIELPAIANVQYIYYAGPCYEWGMIGWLLSEDISKQHAVSWQQHKYFIFLSSAVRGPFLPAYLQDSMHWTDPFLSRLTDKVKLVGSTVVCGDAPSQPEGAFAPRNASVSPVQWRHNPHVPFSALATDRVGLDVLRSDPEVMKCHVTAWSARFFSEFGATAAILKSGFAIDSLLQRYQGVDWSDESSWSCNRRWDPGDVGDFSYDGLSLDPLEVLFVRVNSRLLAQRVPMALKAVKYSTWVAGIAAAAAGRPHNLSARVLANQYQAEKGRFKLPRVLTAMVRGMECFDVPFFKAHNKDILQRASSPLTWKFFVYLGQFEDRPYRFTCGVNYSSIAIPPGVTK